MSNERKRLKIVCFLYVAVAVVCFVLGGATLAGMGDVDAALTTWTALYGALGIATGVLCLVYAGLGIRGANTPRKVTPVRGASVAAVVLSVADVAVGVALDGVSLGEVLYAMALVLAVAGFALAGKVAEQAQL